MDDQFKPVTATPVVDPTKHVNYTYGMVLGVDDFTQEFVYHSGRDQWAARDVDGYGTVSGLRVAAAENAAGEQEVIVSAGAAVNPRGQLICVPTPQCAAVDRWLAVERNRQEAERALAAAPGPLLSLYVVLCYRDCPVDQVPIPGEPCRDEGETVAPSRLKDGFRLELRARPPAPQEERAVRDFARWLRDHVEFTDEAGEGFTDEDSFVEAVRAYGETICVPPPDSPPSSPVEESPPAVMRLQSELRCEYLNAAFRVWVTELRPRCRPEFVGSHCACPDAGHAPGERQGGDEDCVLLAELAVPVTPDLFVDSTLPVRVVEDERPVLVHQRMLQEWLLCGGCCGTGGGVAGGGPGDLVAPPPAPPETPAELVSMSQAVGDGGANYLIWFHPDPSDNTPVIAELDARAMSVFSVGGGEPGAAVEFTVAEVEGLVNVFAVRVGGGIRQVGFVFRTEEIVVRTPRGGPRGASLARFAQQRRIRYVGQHTPRGAGAGPQVTVYAPVATVFGR